MYKCFITILCGLFTIALMFAEIPSAQLLNGLPSVYMFAGKEAVHIENGVVQLVYHSISNNTMSNIVYARIDGGNTSYQVVDSYNFYGYDSYKNIIKGAPTLLLTGNTINIYYSVCETVKQAISTDNGGSFTFNWLDSGPDKCPIVKYEDWEYTSFLTPYDPLGIDYYSIFTNNAATTNETNHYYWGPDEIRGTVRANTDIWIRQQGGGNNNGWPTFYGPVYTTGQIQSFSGTPPYAQVFRAGYYENVNMLKFDNEMMLELITRQADFTYPYAGLNGNSILFVSVNGNAFLSWIGNIVQTGIDTIWVYSSYPPGSGTPLYANYVTRVDTIWAAGPAGPCNDRTMVANCPLWIQGRFSGKQVWYSPYDIKLVDNITLFNTPIGQSPVDDNGNPTNTTDYVALVSGKQIQIQYGYRGIDDSLRYHPNCNDGIYIYASLYAINYDWFGNPRKDGCFTFEYQGPHPSVPDSYFQNNLYRKIDLHRRRYPQTMSEMWPGNIDMPYYNPLWPESSPYMKRGTVRLFGSVYQYRRGFLHRNLTDPEYPNPYNVWYIDAGFFGSPSVNTYTDPVLGTTYSCQNAPGTTGTGVGYNNDHKFDSRINFNTFGFNPFGLGIRLKYSNDGQNWNWNYCQSLNDNWQSKSADIRFGRKVFQYNNHLVCQNTPAAPFNKIDLSLQETEMVKQSQIGSDTNLLASIWKLDTEQDTLRVIRINPVTEEVSTLLSMPSSVSLSALGRNSYGTDIFAHRYADSNFRFYLPNSGDTQQVYEWDSEIGELTAPSVDLNKSTMVVEAGELDTLNIILAVEHPFSHYMNLYYAKGTLNGISNQDNTEPVLSVKVSCYPNPFRNEVSLRVNTGKKVKTTAAVYNIRGQKVKALADNIQLPKGSSQLVWNGRDNQDKAVSAGIYFIRYKIENMTSSLKVIKIQ